MFGILYNNKTKDGDIMSKLSNIITMMELLNNGRKYSIDELSTILEVTPRMIRFYKEELDKAGIYIDTIRGPYGGYVLNQSIRIPTRKFKNSDYLLLGKLAELVDDSSLKKEINILKDKVRGVYQGSIQEKLEMNKEEKDKYNVLSRAIKEKKKVEVLYYSYEKGENLRVIHPIDLYLYYDSWYTSAFCELRNDMRHFELKRIREIKLLEEIYE